MPYTTLSAYLRSIRSLSTGHDQKALNSLKQRKSETMQACKWKMSFEVSRALNFHTQGTCYLFIIVLLLLF